MNAPLFTLSNNAQKQIIELLSKQENSIGLKIGLKHKQTRLQANAHAQTCVCARGDVHAKTETHPHTHTFQTP